MSDRTAAPDNASDADDALAEKLARYAHLMPRAPAELADKVASGSPPGEEEPVLFSLEAARAMPPLTTAGPLWAPLAETVARDRALGCILGLAVGDAIGAPFEFKPRGSFPPVTAMTGGGPFDLQPGQWTDDTTMALCLGESLLAMGDVDQADLMERLQRWMTQGENSVNGRCFDIGVTTRAAIERFIATGEASAGSAAPDTAGNASLVRLGPLAVFYRRDRALAQRMAAKQSCATHAAPQVLDACQLFAAILVDALAGADTDLAMRPRVMALTPKLLFMSGGDWKDKRRDEIRSGGYVVETLEAALWSVWHTRTFRDAVLTAANLGGDSDSVAAVAGQLAGALYGAAAIPAEWLATLAWREKIAALATALFERD